MASRIHQLLEMKKEKLIEIIKDLEADNRILKRRINFLNRMLKEK